MKETLRAWLGRVGRYEPVWRLYRLLNFFAACLAEPSIQAAKARASDEDAAYAKGLSPTLAVLYGPFKGMRYPSAHATGSTLVPKILGCYERELHPVIDRILARDYSDIIDIGCAEGYYAVGLGTRLRAATIHAFDVDARARRLCTEMARHNGIEDRLRMGSLCDERVLLGLKLGHRALVISDCEGYEARLFTPRVAAFLRSHDVLIEVHDAHDPDLPQSLRERFASTHDVTVVTSVDDRQKPHLYQFADIASFDSKTRRRLLSEGRAGLMEWLYFTPKQSALEHERLLVAGG